jgi:fatty-acid peroxygenase
VLFDEAAKILAAAAARWVGLPAVCDTDELAQDCLAMVDGFATAGPRHWRARAARRRQEQRLTDIVAALRGQPVVAHAPSALAVVAQHRDDAGELLHPHTAAVELLNVIRPTVAMSWFVAFAAHALHRWPEHLARLRDGDAAFAEAFAHETRRFYPFAPFVGGRAVQDVDFAGHPIPRGAVVLLDLYGQNHDPRLWKSPYMFVPERFLGSDAGAALDPWTLVPQGGGDRTVGHRCPGEPNTVALLADLAVRLARLDYTVPPQDLDIPLHRVPTRPRSGMRITPRAGTPRG